MRQKRSSTSKFYRANKRDFVKSSFPDMVSSDLIRALVIMYSVA